MADSTTAALRVDEARARILADVAVMPAEAVSLTDLALHGAPRVLAGNLAARLTQPPFDASAMDGYACRSADVATLPVTLDVIGEAAAGHGFVGVIGPGQCVRIFTGAPLPEGAEAIVIQENTTRDSDRVTVREGRPDSEHVRPRGGDFTAGVALLEAGRVLSARDITLAAAMGHGHVPVRVRPRVGLIATGDELVLPGTLPGPDQIVCSNTFGLAAMVTRAGGEAHILEIARDCREELAARVDAARHMDVIVTIGGASVGDHDLVGPVLAERGMALDFWKIAMRPGKPLLFGRLGATRVLGLPGNPVSSLVCGQLFLVPLVRALLGITAGPDAARTAICDAPLSRNGPREHYMRATSSIAATGEVHVTPVRSQDSSLMSPLAGADCLIVRPIGAAAEAAGAVVPVIPLEG